mgnify:CR=1 FL=1
MAAGGGKHGPLYAAAGAAVTVIHHNPAMLEPDPHGAVQRRVCLRVDAGLLYSLS